MVKKSLLSLPAELRNMISTLAVVGVIDEINNANDFVPSPIQTSRYDRYGSSLLPPPLARVNRQLRHEVIPIYYGKNKFSIAIPICLGPAIRAFTHRCNLSKKYFPLMRSLHATLDAMCMEPIDMMDWILKLGERPDLSQWEGLGDYLSATVWALYFRPDMKDWAILEDAVSRAWHTQESMILLDDTDHSHRLVWVL